MARLTWIWCSPRTGLNGLTMRGGDDGEDADLGRVDDRGELADAVRAEVAYGERRTRQLVLLQPLDAGAVDEVGGLHADLGQAHLVDVAQDRHDQAVLQGDGHAE